MEWIYFAQVRKQAVDLWTCWWMLCFH